MSRPINFTDTIIEKKPYVDINGTEYEVQDGTYNGGTDLNAETFNKMQDELDPFRNLFSTQIEQADSSYKRTKDFIIVKPGATYVLSSKDNNVNFVGNLKFYDINQEFVSQLFTFTQPFVIPENCYYIKIIISNTNLPDGAKIQLEEGAIATSYIPWKGYIVESGSNDNGSYVKYSDGTMICRHKIQVEVAVNTTLGSLYRSESIIFPNFPVAFNDIPNISFYANGNNTGIITNWVATTNENPGSQIIIYPTTRTSLQYIINYIAIGKWF